MVLGNHDAAAIDMLDMVYFNSYARDAVLWNAMLTAGPLARIPAPGAPWSIAP